MTPLSGFARPRALLPARSSRWWVFFAIALLSGSLSLHAHNLVDRNVQGISSATEIKIGPSSITIDFWVRVGDIEATTVRRAIDRDLDLRLSEDEKAAYFRVIEDRIHDSGFVLEIDGQMVALACAPIVVDYGKDPESVGTEPILYNVAATAPLPKGSEGEHRCEFYVQNTIDRPVLMKVFTLEDGGVKIAAAPGAFPDVQKAGFDGIKCGMTENVGVSLRFGTGVVSGNLARAPASAKTTETAESDGLDARAKDSLNAYIKKVVSGDWSIWLILSSIGVAAFFGGAHALAPGHGKTLVAAYLVGTRGRKMDAVTLGLTVTATHTSTVILACLFAIWLQRRYNIDQEDIAVGLGVVGGLIIVGIGLWLFWTRLQALRTGIEPDHGHSHGPFGEHLHGPAGHDHGHGPHAHRHDEGPQVHDHGSWTHAHDHGEAPHHHPHDHGTLSPDPVTGAHTHADGTTHTHPVEVEEVPELTPLGEEAGLAGQSSVCPGERGRKPAPREEGRFPLWSLISLGISGGIVPCPTAIVIFMSSLALRVPEYGLLLIVAFGVGLASVLVVIGLLLVSGRARMELSPRVERVVKRLPIVSAVLVTAIGIGLTLKALMDGGYLK